MAISVREVFRDRRFEEKDEDYSGNEGSDLDYDSDQDPRYNGVAESCSKFLKLSIDKKVKSRSTDMQEDSEADPDEVLVIPELSKKDKESYENVRKMIEDGQIEILKVDQCKVYLRKNGLRLTGNKDTLIQRIKKHTEILNGGGEKRYPAYSFVLNCKGDACTGDVVMFEQNVYEMFNLASRTGNGPPCGTRIIAGRIVKESYGASKQQHTFTIEVYWSKGEKPLPPLHPLLVKGRNLYRLRTLRQRWDDEGERYKILMEKHKRGGLARSDRETRIKEKEMRKIVKSNRLSRKEPSGKQPNSKSISTAEQPVLSLKPVSHMNSGKHANHPHPSGLSTESGFLVAQYQPQGPLINSGKLPIQSLKPVSSVNSRKPANHPYPLGVLAAQYQSHGPLIDSGKLPVSSVNSGKPANHPHPSGVLAAQYQPHGPSTDSGKLPVSSVNSGRPANQLHPSGVLAAQSQPHRPSIDSGKLPVRLQQPHFDVYLGVPATEHGRSGLSVGSENPTANPHPEQKNQMQSNCNNKTYQNLFMYANTNHCRQPLTNLNHFPQTNLLQRQGQPQQQLCRHYARGKCYYGDNCKFLHEQRNENVHGFEERLNPDQN